MKQRIWVRIVPVVLIFLSLGLGTARAHQLWTENQARAALSKARTTTLRAFSWAHRQGLSPEELAAARGQLSRLDRWKPPASTPLWGSDRETFFRRQANAYRRLATEIGRYVRTATTESRSIALVALANLHIAISSAQPYGIDSTSASSSLAQLSTALRSAKDVREYRWIARAAAIQTTGLTAAIKAEQRVAGTILTAAGNTLAGVLKYSDAEVAFAQSQLSLLDVFTKDAARYQTALTALSNDVHTRHTLLAAALKAGELHSVVQSIGARFARVIPAKVILVSTETQSATMYQDGRQVYATPVTTGGPELPTDLGIFHVYLKASPFEFHSPWPPGSPYYYPPTAISFWMPFDGAEGLHDASWRSNFGPGSNLEPTDLGTGRTILGTHGCVNLPFSAAQWLWDWAPVGTTVVVV